MPPRPPDDAPALLGLLLHRLASPLGAMANYVHVLPADDLGCKDGLADAVGDARAAMDEARGWIEAAGAVHAEGPTAASDLATTLEAACSSAARPTEMTTAALPPVGAAQPALRWLLDALLREADAAFPAGAMRMTAEPHAPGDGSNEVVRVTLAATTPRAGAPEMTDRMRLADALARRLGGRVEAVEDASGTGALRLSLPTARPPTPEASEPR